MFKSKKKDDMPKALTYEEILEDLEAIKIEEPELNRSEIVKDLEIHLQGGNGAQNIELNIDQWWDCYEAYNLQMQEMENLKIEIDTMKLKLIEVSTEVKEAQLSIGEEMSENLKKIKKFRNLDS